MSTTLGDRGHLHLYLNRDLTDRERIALELLGTYLDRSLARLDRERERDARTEKLAFVNQTLRHDLQNDLSLVDAHLTEIESTFDTPPDHWSIVTDRVTEMDQFLDTMQDDLDVIEQDTHNLEPIALHPLLTERANRLNETFPDAELTYDAIPDASVWADHLLDHVFENLLQNAIEHNDADTPQVTITGWVEMETATIEITDNGPGIPPEQKTLIQDETPASNAGFGLQLVTEAIDSYDGPLEIQDNDPRGTTIRITLQRANPPQPQWVSRG